MRNWVKSSERMPAFNFAPKHMLSKIPYIPVFILEMLPKATRVICGYPPECGAVFMPRRTTHYAEGESL